MRFARSAMMIAFVTLAGASTASAATWAPSSSPVIAYEDGVGQGAGYGSWTPSRTGSTAKWSSTGYIKDLKIYNDSIYYQVDSRARNCPTCPDYNGSTEQSGRWNGGTYKNFPLTDTMSTAWHYGWARVKVCEDQRFSPDACSASVSTVLVYY